MVGVIAVGLTLVSFFATRQAANSSDRTRFELVGLPKLVHLNS